MNAARMTQAALWLMAALLLGLTVWPFVAPTGTGGAQPAERQVRPALPPTLADLELSPIESFAETLNRPLFTATRRPPSPLEQLQGPRATSAPTAAKGEKVILGKYILRGVVVTPDQKLLLLKQMATGQIMRLKVGDALDDGRIAAIAQDHVLLERAGKQEKLSLKAD